jgi:hypothetical protein
MTISSLGLTILFEHVFVGISRSQGCKKTTCKNAKTKGQNRARKGKEKTPTIAPTLVFEGPSVHPTVSSLFLFLLGFDPFFGIFACGFLASLGPRNAYKDMLKQYG